MILLLINENVRTLCSDKSDQKRHLFVDPRYGRESGYPKFLNKGCWFKKCKVCSNHVSHDLDQPGINYLLKRRPRMDIITLSYVFGRTGMNTALTTRVVCKGTRMSSHFGAVGRRFLTVLLRSEQGLHVVRTGKWNSFTT